MPELNSGYRPLVIVDAALVRFRIFITVLIKGRLPGLLLTLVRSLGLKLFDGVPCGCAGVGVAAVSGAGFTSRFDFSLDFFLNVAHGKPG